MRSRGWALGATLLLAAAFIFLAALPDWRGDGAYYAASRLLLSGRLDPQVYDNTWMLREVAAQTEGRVSDVFRPNPPTAALLALPVAWLPPAAARRVWAGLNVLVLWGTMWMVGREAFGRDVFRAPQAALPLLSALAFALFADPIVEGFSLGQAYILLLALFALAWRGLRRRRSAAAGLSLALAFMLKTSGGPLWLLLLLRREWRALGWAVGGCLAVFGLSLPWIGVDMWRAYLTDVLPAAASSPTVAVAAFQSVPGFWAHLFRFDAQWNPAPLADLPGVASALSLASLLVVIGLTLLAAARGAPAARMHSPVAAGPSSRSPDAPDPSETGRPLDHGPSARGPSTPSRPPDQRPYAPGPSATGRPADHGPSARGPSTPSRPPDPSPSAPGPSATGRPADHGPSARGPSTPSRPPDPSPSAPGPSATGRPLDHGPSARGPSMTGRLPDQRPYAPGPSATGRPPGRGPLGSQSSGTHPLDPAFGALAAVSVFLVPFAEQHHYTLLALPVALAAAEWNRTRGALAGVLLAVGALLVAVPLPYEAPALAAGWRALLAYPRLYGGLLVWGMLLHYALRPPQAGAR